MKKLIALFVLLSFLSCGKPEDENATSSKNSGDVVKTELVTGSFMDEDWTVKTAWFRIYPYKDKNMYSIALVSYDAPDPCFATGSRHATEMEISLRIPVGVTSIEQSPANWQEGTLFNFQIITSSENNYAERPYGALGKLENIQVSDTSLSGDLQMDYSKGSNGEKMKVSGKFTAVYCK